MPRPRAHEKNRTKSAHQKKPFDSEKRKLKSPSDPEQAMEWLRDAAHHLSSVSCANDRFLFVAQAINKFLSYHRPKPADLARELALVYPAGRPRSFKERTIEKNRARRIHRLALDGKNMNQISKLLKIPYRTVVRTYNKYSSPLEKEPARFDMDFDFRAFLRSERRPS